MVFRMSELKIKKPNEILLFLKAPKKKMMNQIKLIMFLRYMSITGWVMQLGAG